MVYAAPINLDTNNNSNNIITKLDDPAYSTRQTPVRVYYAYKAIDEITGPVPMVDLSKTYNVSEGGITYSVTTKATLSGKIVRSKYYDPLVNPSGSGTAVIARAINDLTDLFKSPTGIFEIKCGSTVILSGSGVKVLNLTANKSNDNWIFSSDYNIELEFSEPIYSGIPLIKNGTDSWSLEPVEEYVYMNQKITVNGNQEYHNPILGYSNAGTNPKSGPTSPNLDIVTIPQFRLSRKVSADGLPSHNVVNYGGVPASANYSAYINAKKWVEMQLASSFNGNSASGYPKFSSNTIFSIDSFDKIFLYNHLRTINFNTNAGSYEVNDTWLAMPTGLNYLEDYTVESNTDEKNIKTVKVQGQIKGLMMSSLPVMTGQADKMIPDNNGIISITGLLAAGTTGGKSMQRLDELSQTGLVLSDSKYINAVSGWLHDIKPYIYRRACMVVDSLDRNAPYVQFNYSPQPPLNNPIYSHERMLNIIPIATTESHDPRKGIVSYTYEFNNKLKLLSGVISENITINDTGPVDVINQAFVLGRRLGPVLQSLGTTTSSTKSVTVEIIVGTPTGIDGCLITSNYCPVWTGGTTYKAIEELIDGLAPFGRRVVNIFPNMSREPLTGQVYLQQNDLSWNPTEGRYIRNVSWVYQHCSIGNNYNRLNH